MSLLSQLSDLEKLELKFSSVYRLLAEKFAADEEASQLFWKLSFEEEGHAQSIRFQKRLIMTDPMGFENLQIETGDLAEAGRLLDLLLTAPDIDLETALDSAHEIEVGASEYLFKQAVASSNANLVGLMKSLGGSETEHAQALNDFIRRRCFNLSGRGKRNSVL